MDEGTTVRSRQARDPAVPRWLSEDEMTTLRTQPAPKAAAPTKRTRVRPRRHPQQEN